MRRALVLVAVMGLLSACSDGSPRPAATVGRTTTTSSGLTTTSGSSSTSTTTTAPSTSGPGVASATGMDGGLTIELTANPDHGPTGTPVTFILKAVESSAPGALHYQVTYGDGGMDSNVTPQVCTAGPGQPVSQTWTLMHQYATAATFTVTATVGVNCSPNNASATLTVSPIGT